MNYKVASRFVGLVGAWCCVIIFVLEPSFPTPDKILIFLTFLFMAFSEALAMLKRFLPFVAILLVYESFRGIADHLNTHVNYTFMPKADEFIFGKLPVYKLQDWLYEGYARWYDYIFYAPYLLHFILPIALAVVVWKRRAQYYWRLVTTYLVVSYMGFLTFLAFPAAPPWMASKAGVIAHVNRISSDVWSGLGLHDFPTFYHKISPNAVAAVPSLHAAWATLFSLFIFKFFGKKWGGLSLIYPALIYVGTVYQGEHYAFDIAAGIVYGVVAFLITPPLMRWVGRFMQKIARNFKATSTNNTKSASE